MNLVQTVLTTIACFIIANAGCAWIFDTKQYLPADYYSPLTVVAGGWLLSLIFAPKRYPALGLTAKTPA